MFFQNSISNHVLINTHLRTNCKELEIKSQDPRDKARHENKAAMTLRQYYISIERKALNNYLLKIALIIFKSTQIQSSFNKSNSSKILVLTVRKMVGRNVN